MCLDMLQVNNIPKENISVIEIQGNRYLDKPEDHSGK